MCEKCFDNEIFRFESQSDFHIFETKFDKKTNFIELTNSKHNYLNVFVYTYTCKSCYENWWLSIPENAWRGFFLTETKATLYFINGRRTKNLRLPSKKRKRNDGYYCY